MSLEPHSSHYNHKLELPGTLQSRPLETPEASEAELTCKQALSALHDWASSRVVIMLAALTCQVGCQRVMRELTDTQERSGPTEGLQLGASWAGEPKDAWEEGDAWDCGHRGWWPAISPRTGSACCALSSAGSIPEGFFCTEKVVGLKRSCGLGTVSLLVLQQMP